MSQSEIQELVEQFANFAGNMSARVEKLESRFDEHSRKVDDFLFVDTEERTSLATLSTRIDRHISVMCDYAKFAKWAFLVIASVGGAAAGIVKLLEVFPR